MVHVSSKILLLANAVALAWADVATWPSSLDELEDLMVLNSGYGARNFPGPLVPCDSPRVPGFSIAAGFLRTAFHDMAPANAAAGTGGLDASIGYELDNPYAFANRGPAFNNTVTYLSRFYNSRVSMADLIALGTYASVRACGGPIVPLRGGRIDATGPGDLGVPDARDNGDLLTSEFQRMGLTQAEGIELVACGHTLGGVHTRAFPSIVPPNTTPLGVSDFDTTNSTFDNKVVTEYLSGTTKNPLVVGPDVLARSDFRVFSLDNNQTVAKMADASAYKQTCATILQKMIDTVPSGVQLTQPITPYDVKPSQLQLTLTTEDTLSFSGQLRIKLNQISKSDIAKVQLIYKERDGGNSCGDCKIDASELGDASGFDDKFVFYGFSTTLSAAKSISSFNVLITLKSGTSTTYDNNGKGFPLQDKIFTQAPNSSLAPVDGSGKRKLTVAAALRNGETTDASLTVYTINPLTFNHLPTTSQSSVPMIKGCESKYYTYYTATFDLSPADAATAKFDVSSGSDSDAFKSLAGLPVGAAVAVSCSGKNSTSTTTSSTTSTTSTSSGKYFNGTTTSTGYGVTITSSEYGHPTTSAVTTSSISTTTNGGASPSWSAWSWPKPSEQPAVLPNDGNIDWSANKNTTEIIIVNENWIGQGSNDMPTHNSGKPDEYDDGDDSDEDGDDDEDSSSDKAAGSNSSSSGSKTDGANSGAGSGNNGSGSKTGSSAQSSTSSTSIASSTNKGSGNGSGYGDGYTNGTATSSSIIAKYTGAANSLAVSSGLTALVALVAFMLA